MDPRSPNTCSVGRRPYAPCDGEFSAACGLRFRRAGGCRRASARPGFPTHRWHALPALCRLYVVHGWLACVGVSDDAATTQAETARLLRDVLALIDAGDLSADGRQAQRLAARIEGAIAALEAEAPAD